MSQENPLDNTNTSLPNEKFTLDSGTNLVRIPIAKKGSWYHSKYGVVEFNDDDFESLQRNFESNTLGYKPYITFGHLHEEHQSTDSQRKKGELVRFDKEGETLFGIFSAKEDALEAIKAGDYEFASGEFIRQFKDKDTGDERGLVFERGALTNSPFIPFDEKDKALALSNNDITCFKLSMNIASIEEPPVKVEQKAPETEPQQETKEEIKDKVETDKDLPATEEPTQEPQKAEAVVEQKPEEQPIIQKESDMPENKHNLSSSVATPESETATQPEVKEETKEVKETVTEQKDTNEVVEPKVETKSESAPQETKAEQPDIEALVKQAVESAVSDYKTQISDLKSQVENQEKLSNQFSQRIAQEQKLALSNSLASVGVPPALIDRLHLIRQALSNQSNTIKLSQGEKEVDVDVLTAVTTLLTDALGVEPVQENQVGQVKTQQEDEIMESLRSIASRNRKLVETN